MYPLLAAVCWTNSSLAVRTTLLSPTVAYFTMCGREGNHLHPPVQDLGGSPSSDVDHPSPMLRKELCCDSGAADATLQF